MQYYDISVAANGQQDVQAPGRYLYYLNGNAGGADNTIVVKLGMGGTKVLLKPGQSVRLPADAKDITDWVISNYANTATILGQVLIGKGEFTDSTISGSVQVIDGGKSRTLAGGAFVANGGANAVAAQYSCTQLWNPAGSGKRLIVESLQVVAVAAPVTAQLLFMNTLLGGSTINQYGQSKLAGGAASAAAAYGVSTASSASSTPFMTLSAATYSSPVVKLAEPFILQPGWGLTLWGASVNTTMGANFEWYEESI